MKILVIGANGKIGQLLLPLLREAGHEPRAMVRDDAQARRWRADGYDVVVGDLEDAFEHAFEGCDAAIFTAGSGPQTGGDKTLLVDLWGAVRCIGAAERHNVTRFVMVSSRRADDPQAAPAKLRHYLVAKHFADRELADSALAWTIVRPGRLVDEEGDPGFTIEAPDDEDAQLVSRQGVAQCLLRCIERPDTVGCVFELYRGEAPLDTALDAALLACRERYANEG